MAKVSFIGAGNVGSTVALVVISKQISDVVLIDVDAELASGKAMDLNDYQGTINGNVSIAGGSDYSLITDSDVIVISAGRARKKGESLTREDLAKTNTDIIKKICLEIKKYSPNSIVLTITNPLDKMNLLVFKELGFSRNKIIGVGGVLDSSRLKTIIASELDVSISSVSGMVIGPHSDNMIPMFSKVTVAGNPVSELISAEKLSELKKKIQLRGKEITSLMGSGYYAIGSAAAVMIESILLDKNEIFSASVILNREYGIDSVSIGVPATLGKNGATVVEMEFSERNELLEEAKKL